MLTYVCELLMTDQRSTQEGPTWQEGLDSPAWLSKSVQESCTGKRTPVLGSTIMVWALQPCAASAFSL